MPQSFESAWAASEQALPDWLRNPPTDVLPEQLAGDRIRVTHVSGAEQEPALYVGATGTVIDHALGMATCVQWDDEALNTVGIALLDGIDRWEVL